MDSSSMLAQLMQDLNVTEKSSPVEILRSTTSIDPAQTFEARVARSRVAADVANNNNAVFYGAPSNAGNSACYWPSPPAVPAPAHSDTRRPCYFYSKGQCKFGDRCRYSHAKSVPPQLPSTRVAAQSKTASKRFPCAICLEIPNLVGRRFGILPLCNHTFCLPCIRSWRKEHDLQQTARTCPICRTKSFFVVPSDAMVLDPDRKAKLISDYRRSMKTIPCRHFQTNRSCPFGSSCFYAHLGPDGKPSVPERMIVTRDSEGKQVSLPRSTLSDFMR